MLTSRQRSAVVTAVVAILLWVAVVVMIALTPPDAGANIGAGLVGLLALAVSASAAGLVIAGARTAPPRVAGAAALVLFGTYLVLAGTDAAYDGVLIGVGVAAIAALASGAVLTVVESRRRQ